MALEDAVLETYFQDAEVEVSFNGATAVPAIKDEFEDPALEGATESASLVKTIALTCRATDVTDVEEGATAEYEGGRFLVRQRRLIHEGKCVHFLLKDDN